MKLNGCDTPLSKPISLKNLLEDKGYNLTRVATEMNGSIIPKADYDKTMVTDNDTLEVVTFVGGG